MKPFTVVCTSVHLSPGDSEPCVCALVCVCWRVRVGVRVFVSQRRSLPSDLHLLSQRCLLQRISTSSKKKHTKVCCRFLKNTNLWVTGSRWRRAQTQRFPTWFYWILSDWMLILSDGHARFCCIFLCNDNKGLVSVWDSDIVFNFRNLPESTWKRKVIIFGS